MAVTEKDVRHIASLARLELGEAETLLYVKQLSSILDLMEELKRLEERAASAPEKTENVTRADEPFQFQEREEILANLPAREFDFAKVKKVLQ